MQTDRQSQNRIADQQAVTSLHQHNLSLKCNWNTTATTTGTRSDIGNGNYDTQTTTQQLRNAREGMDVVLTMVLTENVLTLLLMMLIKAPVRDVLTLQLLLLLLMTMMKMMKVTPRWNASLVVSSNRALAVESGPAITITKWATALGHLQGTRP